jgi:hypothetical protein
MSSDDRWVSAELREALSRGDLPALAEAGLLKQQDLEYLLSFKRSIEDGEDTDRYQELLMQAVSKKVNRAVEHGNLSVMSHANGISQDRVDASTVTFRDKMEELWKPHDRDHMLNLVIYAPPPPTGPTGVGKTDTAYTLIEGGELVHSEYGGLTTASNNTTDPFDDVQSWTELEDWLEATDGTKVFLWDEAAQVLQFDDINAGRALSRLIKLLRKYECHLILIGHTGKDIPKDVRRMVLFCVKESKYKAEIGAGLEEDQAGWMQIKNVLFRLGNIKETAIDYESIGDKGHFTFDDEEGGSGSGVDEKPQCWAISQRSGNVCGNDAITPEDDPVLCVNHRGADVEEARERRENSESG